MKAIEKNEIVKYSTNYDMVLIPDKKVNLNEYADMIEKVYSISTLRTKQVCRWLRGTEGTITKNRHGQTFLKFRKHIDE